MQLKQIPINQIDDPERDLREWSDEALEQLAGSVAAMGVKIATIVRSDGNGRYERVAGKGRVLAAKQAGQEKVPAVVIQATDEEALLLSITENMPRREMSAFEIGQAMRWLIEDFSYSKTEAGRLWNIEASTVDAYLAVANFYDKPEIANFGADTEIPKKASVMQFKATGPLRPWPAKRVDVLKTAVERDLTIRETEGVAKALASGKRPKTTAKKKSKDEWKTPAVADLITAMDKWLKDYRNISTTAAIGKMSPEAVAFVLRRCELRYGQLAGVIEELKALAPESE